MNACRFRAADPPMRVSPMTTPTHDYAMNRFNEEENRLAMDASALGMNCGTDSDSAASEYDSDSVRSGRTAVVLTGMRSSWNTQL